LKIDSIQKSLSQVKTTLFPEVFSLKGINTAIRQIKRPNGGWGDARDHYLCESFVTPNEPEVQIFIN